MSIELGQYIQKLLQACPPEYRLALRGFYSSLENLTPEFQWKPRDNGNWVFSIQEVQLAIPDQDKYLGLRILFQLSTPFTHEPRMVAEIPVMFQIPGSVEALAVAMRNLDENVVPDKYLGDLASYIRGLRDIVLNIVRRRVNDGIQQQQQMQQQPQQQPQQPQMPQQPYAMNGIPPNVLAQLQMQGINMPPQYQAGSQPQQPTQPQAGSQPTQPQQQPQQPINPAKYFGTEPPPQTEGYEIPKRLRRSQ